MDPFSLTTGVIGLLAVIANVTQTIDGYLTAVKERKQDIRDLHQELLLLGRVLGQLRDFLALQSGKDAAFDHDSVLRDAISSCTTRLQRVGERLKPSKQGKVSQAIEKLKWPFEQDEVNKLVTSLQRFVQTFTFALTTTGLAILSKTSDAAEAALYEQRNSFRSAAEMLKQNAISTAEIEAKISQVEGICAFLPSLQEQAVEIKEMGQHLRLMEEHEQARQKSEILEWLAPASSLRRHLETQKKRVDSTCGWFLRSEIFQNWQDLSVPAHDVLCIGNPGTGKTILSSLVFDHLRTRYRNEGVIITNYYCSHFDEATQSPSHFARVFLRQICQSLDRTPAAVVEFYRDTRHDTEDILWIQALLAVIRRVVATCDNIFLIIDALDEIENLEQRKHLLRMLNDARSTGANFKVLVTARPHLSQLPAQLLQPSIVDISARPEDVEQFLRQRMAEQADRELIDASFEQEIVDKLTSGSSGTFLLPALQLDSILQQLNRADMRRSLAELSHTLEEAYKSSFDRISALPSARRDLALRAMTWVSLAKRPLLMTELQHALATREGESDLDPENLVPPRLIIECCAGLVQHNQDTTSVEFCHFSVDEYLRCHPGVLPFGDALIAKTCITYLLHSSLRQIAWLKEENARDIINNQALFRYAVYHWGIHARRTKLEEYADLALRLFDSNVNVLAISRLRHLDNPYARNWNQQATRWAEAGAVGLSISAFFGLHELIELLISRLSDKAVINTSRNAYGNTPLQDAAGYGHTDACEVLIRHGADLQDSNRGKATAFYHAVKYGRLETAKVLLKYNHGQLEIACQAGWTALHKASHLGDEAMVQFLLQQGAQVAARDNRHRNPLHLAAKRGHMAIIRLLVLAGADVNSSSQEDKPLDLCATAGHVEAAKYLVSQGASINNRGRDGWSTLMRACRGGHLEITKTLLHAGADTLLEDYRQNTCLTMACRSGNLALVKFLMTYDLTIRRPLLKKRDRNQRTAQQIAFMTAHVDIYKYLRDLENLLDAEDGQHTPVQLYNPFVSLAQAIEAGDVAAVERLIRNDPDVIHYADDSGQQAIHTAFIESQSTIADLLLDAGASIHARGFHGWTPLHIAAASGDLKMTDLALKNGADVEERTGTAQTPLLKAASSGSVAVLQRLLEAGADICARNDRGMTPLHVAATKSFMEGLRELLQPQWNGQHVVHARDRQKNLPRHWAERSGHLEAAAFLRLQEKLIEKTARDGWRNNSVRSAQHTEATKTNTLSSQPNLVPLESPSRTPTGFSLDEETDKFAQMILEMDSDQG